MARWRTSPLTRSSKFKFSGSGHIEPDLIDTRERASRSSIYQAHIAGLAIAYGVLDGIDHWRLREELPSRIAEVLERGADYRYALKGDGQTPFEIVPGEEQRDALETVLSTLSVDFLALSEDIVSLIPPPAFRYAEGEAFPGRTEQLFDPLGAAEAAASFTVGEILQPQRMARLVVFGAQGNYPDLEEVTDRLIEVTWDVSTPGDEYRRQVLRVAQRAVADQMMQQASMDRNSAQVRAVLSDRLDLLAERLEGLASRSPHERLVSADIRRWQARIENTVPGPTLAMPAGDPIGGSNRN